MTNALSLEHISVSAMDNNCYLVCSGSHGLLIDAADDAPALLGLAQRAGVTIETVLTTHQHWDHVRALEEVLAATGATHYAAALDAPNLPAHVDIALEHGDTIDFDGHELDIVVLRGHTTGGAAVVADISGVTNLFVGDSLFPGGVGKTGSDADFEQLYQDVTKRLFDVYPDTAIVWPGHGKSTTLGAERPHLPAWYERRW